MSYLQRILEDTRGRVDALTDRGRVAELRARAESVAPARDLRAALDRPDVGIIAELKRRSPSKGELNEHLEAGAAALSFAAAGAAALSVLTEPSFFGGSLEDLARVSPAAVPVLRKDFIVDAVQLLEARAWGADAALLIARVVKDDLERLVDECRGLGLTPLVEVFDEGDLRVARKARAPVVGVNHRDLDTFEVDPQRTRRLAPEVDWPALLVGLSGVSTRSDVESLARDGARAVLVGEALMTSPDPAGALSELVGVPAT